MDKKKALILILVGVLAAVLTAVLLLPGQDAQPPAGTQGTTPALQEETVPTRTEPTLPTESVPTVPTEPSQPEPTDPVQTDPEPSEPEPTAPDVTEPEPTEPPTQPLPGNLAELEGGLVTVRNLFQFTGMNPDADNVFGEDIAGIEMTNNSNSHMTFAEVTVILEDGTVLTFQAEDVPAGRTVLVFSQENAPIRNVRSCEEVYGYAEFGSGDPLAADLVQITANGAEFTVKNVSGTDLTDLEVSCHGLLDSSFFGGSAYRFTISSLPAGASTAVYVEDCYLGMVEVVRVDRGG